MYSKTKLVYLLFCNKIICDGERFMLISIVIAAYNAEKNIEKCLRSITRQTYKDIEVIVVDDGSTDATSAICEQMCKEDNRICIVRQENNGPLRARINGIKRSKGEYFLLCDADDYYSTSHAIEQLVSYLERYNSSGRNIDLVQFGYYRKYNHVRVPQHIKGPVKIIQGEEFVETQYPIYLCSYFDKSVMTLNVWNKLYSKGLIRNLDGLNPPKTFMGEDEILNMYLLSKCTYAVVVPDCLYVYQETTGGTNKFRINAMNELNIIKVYQAENLEKYRDKEWYPTAKSMMYTELVGWSLAWVREFPIKSETDYKSLEEKIDAMLQLDAFESARSYWKNRKIENWDAARLLVENDPKKYIQFKKDNPVPSLSVTQKMKKLLKNLI
ncbi:glycosyltransferase [Galactobacillus timonensis]|uniref:glycosyltransferase n=1 Tax=Galactobacillus timonensis TaxID=2041840 RepID=UPI000C853BCB|nr:glycosyltransferase family 2 protein [Galactobacillus timonensis]